MFKRIKNFLEDAKHEFRHVNWPTRKEAARLTLIVIGISLGLAAFLGIFDGIFVSLLEAFIS